MFLSFQDFLKESVFPAVTKQKNTEKRTEPRKQEKSENLCPSVVHCTPASPSLQHVQETCSNCLWHPQHTAEHVHIPIQFYSSTPKSHFHIRSTHWMFSAFLSLDNQDTKCGLHKKVMRKARFLHENVSLRFFHWFAWQLLDMRLASASTWNFLACSF